MKLFNLCLEHHCNRAIDVGSNLGKLFSSIMLERLIQFKKYTCPDTENQLGFCQQAQTADHLFSLHTCIKKHVKMDKRYLYSCFVDLKKAFDTVCRDALLYNHLTFYVEPSKVANGQGHPVSPELYHQQNHSIRNSIHSFWESAAYTTNPSTKSIESVLWDEEICQYKECTQKRNT